MTKSASEIPLTDVRQALRGLGYYWPDGKTTIEVVTNHEGVECLSIQVELSDPATRGGDGE